MALRISQFAGARAQPRAIGRSWISTPRFIPSARVGPSAYRGPIVSRNNPVLAQSFSNFNTMANNRALSRGVYAPNAGGYSEGYNSMRRGVSGGVYNGGGGGMAQQPQQVITINRPSAQRVQGPTLQGGMAVNNSWSAQQNNAGLGRNKRYSNAMSQFAINSSSASAGLNRMR